MGIGPLPNIKVNSATTSDSRTVTLDYTVGNTDLPGPFDIGIYRSSNDTLDPENLDSHTDQQIGSLVPLPATDDNGNPAQSKGKHDVTIELPEAGLVPDPSHPYVFVASNPNNALNEANYDDDLAHFKVWVIADVTYGFSLTGAPPDWAQQMANALMKDARFDSALALDWNSGLTTGPGETVLGGNKLYEQILEQADALDSQLGTDDVIDVQLIGHSRGSAVIGQAMQDLVNQLSPEEPALVRGYYKLTFLDPHPANIDTVGDVSILAPPPYDLAPLMVYLIRSAAYADPSVTVPSRVNQVEDFYQQNSVTHLSLASILDEPLDHVFNLQGDPSQIQIQDPVSTVTNAYDLSPLGIGHSGVWQWYMKNVIQTLGTGSVPPVPASSGGSDQTPDNVNLQQILCPQYIDDPNEASAVSSLT